MLLVFFVFFEFLFSVELDIRRFVMNALKAKEFYRRDVQYIVKNGKALIINEVGFELIFSILYFLPFFFPFDWSVILDI